MENNTPPTQPTLTIALALSGGAARGSFHLGFIQALLKNNVRIAAVSGTSAGAIAGGALACGIMPKEALEIVKSKPFRKLFKFGWFKKSLIKIETQNPLFDKLFPLQDLSQTQIPLYVCATDINANEALFFNSGEGKKLILASCALLPFFEPIPYEGRMLADGGFLELLPTTPLLKYNLPILSINLHPPMSIDTASDFKTIALKAYDFLITSNAKKDKENSTWYISPSELSEVKMHTLADLQKGYDLGYKSGLQWCENTL